jgi:hypothetical protein
VLSVINWSRYLTTSQQSDHCTRSRSRNATHATQCDTQKRGLGEPGFEIAPLVALPAVSFGVEGLNRHCVCCAVCLFMCRVCRACRVCAA